MPTRLPGIFRSMRFQRPKVHLDIKEKSPTRNDYIYRLFSNNIDNVVEQTRRLQFVSAEGEKTGACIAKVIPGECVLKFGDCLHWHLARKQMERGHKLTKAHKKVPRKSKSSANALVCLGYRRACLQIGRAFR